VGADGGWSWIGGGGKEMAEAARVCDGGGAQGRRESGGTSDKQARSEQ
jgi:hypothetical protein